MSQKQALSPKAIIVLLEQERRWKNEAFLCALFTEHLQCTRYCKVKEEKTKT